MTITKYRGKVCLGTVHEGQPNFWCSQVIYWTSQKKFERGSLKKNTGQKQNSLSQLVPYLTHMYYVVILSFSLGWRNLYVRTRRGPLEAGNSIWN
jgi:hypothetical protein